MTIIYRINYLNLDSLFWRHAIFTSDGECCSVGIGMASDNK